MGLLNLLKTKGSVLSIGNGATPNKVSDFNSKLHYTYSINGTPNIPGQPQPSQLDRDGKTPPKYMQTFKD